MTNASTRRRDPVRVRVLGVVRGAAAAHPLTPGDARGGRVNNFDALRLLAALAVLVSHAFALVGHDQPMIGEHDLGTVGVWLFFGISGFLITQSWSIDPIPWRYFAKRGLRILPALVVMLVLTTFVLGPVFTTLPVGEYFASAQTWRYLLDNIIMDTTFTLPGVFVENPYGDTVNGPLWTLAPETWAYVGLVVVGLAGAFRRRWIVPALALVLIAVPFGPTDAIPYLDGYVKAIHLLQAFAVGMSLYLLRDRIPWSGRLALVLVLAFAVAPVKGAQDVLAVTAIPYAAVYLAYRGPAALRILTRRGDFSYGIYIYAWPVGQATVAIWSGIGAAGLIAVSLPLTYALAMASWRFVERPALDLKKRLSPRAAEPRIPAVAAGPPALDVRGGPMARPAPGLDASPVAAGGRHGAA